MQVIFDRQFCRSDYADDNAASPGRMEAAMSGLWASGWEIRSPMPATREELLLTHEKTYLEAVARNPGRYAMASLAAGGAILAARVARKGEPAFACIRPPGHHASCGDAWGYCTFNNLVVALLVLREEKLIQSALVIDIDAHTGDGTRKLLSGWAQAEVFNPFAGNAAEYHDAVAARLTTARPVDMVAVSAGFDNYRLDAGGKLDTHDFELLGRSIAQAAHRLSAGRRFAVLEGGYYLPDLGANVLAFCRGLNG